MKQQKNRNEYAKAWKKKNPDKVKAYGKKYREKNKDKIKKYTEENKEKILELKRNWDRKHSKRIRKNQKIYRAENRDKINQYYHDNKERYNKTQLEWQKNEYATNPEFRRRHKLRQMTRRLSEPLDGLSCINCNSIKDLQRHHPSYDSADFIVLCRKCHQDLHNFLNNRCEYALYNLSSKENKKC